jgi:HlyD family secretion protein
MKVTTLIICAALLCSCDRAKEDAPEKPVVQVKVSRAAIADIPQVVTAPATIFPRDQANVAARITAPIRELRARKGDNVRAGDVLAILENRDLTAQREEAQASLSDAEANLQRTQAGTVPADVERGRGQVETTRAALDQAQKNYDRRKRLFEQGAIPQKDLLQTETELATAKANFEVAQKSLDLLQRQSATGDVAIARSRVEQARARLNGATANLQYTDLRSPFQGTVTEQFQYPGDMAGPGTPTYTIVDLSIVTARAQVPESSASAVQRGQLCTFAAGDGNIQGAKGKITVVNRAVDPARRTVEVWCEVANPPTSLRAGVFGSLSIEIASIKGAVVVPTAAVQINEGTDTGIALVVDEKRIAHRREVQVGVRLPTQIQVRSGLQAGEIVVTEGGYALPDGTEVRIGNGGSEGAKQ